VSVGVLAIAFGWLGSHRFALGHYLEGLGTALLLQEPCAGEEEHRHALSLIGYRCIDQA
jgi:hypothetical protein